MRRKLSSITIIMLVVFLGCSHRLMHTKKSLPDWYNNVPVEETNLYGVGEADGQDLGLTRQDAEAGARDEIVRQIDLKISNMIKRSKQATEGDIDADVIRSASSQVSSQSVSQIKIIERKVITTNDGYIVYALAKLSTNSIKEQAQQTFNREEVKRQLSVNKELQKLLSTEIGNLNGLSQ